MGKDRGFPLRVSRPHAGYVLIEEVLPDQSSQAAGQVFEPDRPHKSLHVLGRRLKTKTLVTALKAVRASDTPSKPVWGREPPGGFDSRPPPRGENGEWLWSRGGSTASPRFHLAHVRCRHGVRPDDWSLAPASPRRRREACYPQPRYSPSPTCSPHSASRPSSRLLTPRSTRASRRRS